MFIFFFFSSRRRHTRCETVTGVQTCALPISTGPRFHRPDPIRGALEEPHRREVGGERSIVTGDVESDEPGGVGGRSKGELREVWLDELEEAARMGCDLRREVPFKELRV